MTVPSNAFSQTVDHDFDEEEQRLLAMESCLRSLQRNVMSWKEVTEVSGGDGRATACRVVVRVEVVRVRDTEMIDARYSFHGVCCVGMCISDADNSLY